MHLIANIVATTILFLPLSLVLADNTTPTPLFCGGNIIQPPCPTGQSCFRWLGLNPDISGICVGQSCDGFIMNPQTCPSGEDCVHRNPIPDVGGTCLDATHRCSADTPCPAGWQCVLDFFAGGCDRSVNPECLCVDNGCTGYCAPVNACS